MIDDSMVYDRCTYVLGSIVATATVRIAHEESGEEGEEEDTYHDSSLLSRIIITI